MVNVLIKNVDKNAYKIAKMLAVQEDKTIGEVVNEAIERLAQQKKKTHKGLSGLTPFSFGPGNEQLSREIDKVLYGSP